MKIHPTHFTQLEMPWRNPMRKYHNFDKFYSELLEDVYAQPEDKGHTKLGKQAIDQLMPHVDGVETVLDVGSGEGFLEDAFEDLGMQYFGVALGEDVEVAQDKNRMVDVDDFNFLPHPDESVDLIFARHALEHSPFPIITLMEWHRVSKKWLCLIAPDIEHYGEVGRNHYSMANARQLRWWLRRAGWKVIVRYKEDNELRYVCKKLPRISCEGWADSPIGHDIYALERDEDNPIAPLDILEDFKNRKG